MAIARLTVAGWRVLRFWDINVANDARSVVLAVTLALRERGRPLRRRLGQDFEDLVTR